MCVEANSLQNNRKIYHMRSLHMAAQNVFGIIVCSIFLFSANLHAATSFDGQWQFSIYTTHGPCFAAPGTITVTNGKIKGTVNGVNETLKVSGKIKNDGTVKGRVSKGLANFKGKLTGGSGEIGWSGRGGCKGKIQLKKL